jgi:RNA polymerase sigma-70 factor (ECF subfamily)
VRGEREPKNPITATAMAAQNSQSGPDASAGGRFATTHWSVVAAAQGSASAEVRHAFGILFSTYWYPLYAYIRRRGYSADQTQDLTQGFFAELLERHTLDAVDRAKGKFRSFLLTACKHYLAHEQDRARAEKRGGGRRLLSLDFGGAEARYGTEPAHALTPDRLFARRWALALLDQVFTRLREEYDDKGKVALFEHLRVFLQGDKNSLPHGQVAQKLGLTEGAVKTAAHRLRRRFREVLREEIAQTVDEPGDIEDEIRELFARPSTVSNPDDSVTSWRFFASRP